MAWESRTKWQTGSRGEYKIKWYVCLCHGSWVDSDSILTELFVQEQQHFRDGCGWACLLLMLWGNAEPAEEKEDTYALPANGSFQSTSKITHLSWKSVSMVSDWARLEPAVPKGPVCLGMPSQSVCPWLPGLQRLCRLSVRQLIIRHQGYAAFCAHRYPYSKHSPSVAVGATACWVLELLPCEITGRAQFCLIGLWLVSLWGNVCASEEGE